MHQATPGMSQGIGKPGSKIKFNIKETGEQPNKSYISAMTAMISCKGVELGDLIKSIIVLASLSKIACMRSRFVAVETTRTAILASAKRSHLLLTKRSEPFE